jgi:HD-like signal output (HDOD) protein
MSYLADNNTKHLEAVDAAQDAVTAEVHSAAKAIVDRSNDLAVLPHVVFKVLELSGTEGSAAAEMERAITVDPAFSAKVLTLANSSFYGLQRKVTSVRDAIVYLGFRTVREMAMTVGMFDLFVGKNDKESLRRRAWWRHSLDTAVCCRFIAQRTGKMDPAEAYTCGLLHYIGKTLLDRFGERDYQFVEQRMSIGTSDIDAEQLVYGCNHQQVAMEAGKKWGLPLPVVASFNYTKPDPTEEGFDCCSACVAVGTKIASLAVDGSCASDHLPAWALAELGVSAEEAQDLYEHCLKSIASAAQMPHN